MLIQVMANGSDYIRASATGTKPVQNCPHVLFRWSDTLLQLFANADELLGGGGHVGLQFG